MSVQESINKEVVRIREESQKEKRPNSFALGLKFLFRLLWTGVLWFLVLFGLAFINMVLVPATIQMNRSALIGITTTIMILLPFEGLIMAFVYGFLKKKHVLVKESFKRWYEASRKFNK